jgi:hypothetical protein
MRILIYDFSFFFSEVSMKPVVIAEVVLMTIYESLPVRNLAGYIDWRTKIDASLEGNLPHSRQRI